MRKPRTSSHRNGGGPALNRRQFLQLASASAVSAALPNLGAAAPKMAPTGRLFPAGLPNRQWLEFRAAGFSRPACGVIYRLTDRVTNGLALGGVDTGCVDLETSGLLGYLTLYNTHVPRRGPVNLPFLGLAVGGRTWVLCDPTQVKSGSGEYQPGGPNASYRLWEGKAWKKTQQSFEPPATPLRLEGVSTATGIDYWGHYPVADLEFATDAPVSVGLRAWAPFLPGDVVDSQLPGIVFEVHVRNSSRVSRRLALALSWPGPESREAGSTVFARELA